MKIYNSITELIGRTPLLNLEKYCALVGAKSKIFAKLEYFNPAGSVKDRVAKNIIDEAENSGLLSKGATIIEPTSGNTGIGIAAIAAAKGYNAIIVMPENMSKERQSLIKAYGAQIILTDASLGMMGAINKAEEIKKETPNSIIAGQFYNPANPNAHIKTTGPEIYEDTDGEIDIFVCGVGTGGTISGIGKYLKSKNKDIKIVAVEPSDSPYLSEKKAGAHKIQGIGAGFIPKTLDTEIFDEIMLATTEDSYNASRNIAKTEGVLVGISSGAALWAATQLSKLPENKGKNIVVLLPDSGERYLSTDLFDF